MLFVCWLWRGNNFPKKVARYNQHHVNVLASMLKRHGNHKLICVQDGSFDIENSIVMPQAVATLPDYLPKLWAWSKDFQSIIGEKYISIDLDVVIFDDLSPIFDNDEKVLIWNSAAGEPYNSSLFSVECGYGNEIWERFSIRNIERAKRETKRWTGDQSWIAYIDKNIKTFGEETGVVRYRRSAQQKIDNGDPLKAVFLCGPSEPSKQKQNHTWIRDNYK